MHYDIEIVDLKDRVSSLEAKREHTNTALDKIIVILEETRLRTTANETRLDRVEHEIKAFRRDMS
ncbi:MAG: hypothetical protein SGJ17_04815 [Hyphomicrobiales bacterium]|nr:hypothetical protein [Hyphomicrobiales bacterium]